MGEEVRIDDTIAEWEAGLPSLDDLTPLSQSLIPAELASAFKISPEPSRTDLDVNRASESTMSSLRGGAAASNFNPFGGHVDDHVMSEVEPEEGSDSKRTRRVDSAADDPAAMENCGDDQSTAAGAKTLKRPRLVWTPQLHKRFVDVVAHLGLKNAVPKTIMQLMNVEGLTRENVASHLQKYRLYVKRMQGLSNEGPSPSDHLFASTPVPLQSFNESSSGGGGGGGGASHGNGIANGSHGNGGNGNSGSNHVALPMSMPYPQIMPMQLMGMAAQGHGFHGYDAAHSHHSLQYQQHYNSVVQQQRDWPGNKFNGYSHHIAQNNNKC